MYLSKVVNKNVGPLSDVNLTFPLDDQHNPKPIVLVGENGSGKSIFLSNIVDALYEFGSKAFSNVQRKDENLLPQYFKAIVPVEIQVGKQFMYSYALFKHSGEQLEYVSKSGTCDFESLKQHAPDTKLTGWKDGNDKHVMTNESLIEQVFENNVIAYFGPHRYEKPIWLGSNYYRYRDFEHITIKNKWSGQLDQPIMVEEMIQKNLPWLLDVIADSRIDINFEVKDSGKINLNLNYDRLHIYLKQYVTRQNIEKIMSQVLNHEVVFDLNSRNQASGRFSILDKKSKQTLIPSLASLSTGQSALFNMFSTIVRYADEKNISQSQTLEQIEGIVVIDEIELHLHSKLQREVLPKLIKLFPRVQFIITTHSPLFLLGMDEVFTEDGYDIFELPSCEKITSEKFTLFKEAYEYLKQTDTFKKEQLDVINKFQEENGNKTLVITEGSTDWMHLKAAWNELQQNPEFQELEFDFLEYSETETEGLHHLEMGNKALEKLCQESSKIPRVGKLIFIADRDRSDTISNLSERNGMDVKRFSNNVFSFVLPVPDFRQSTPSISIEHLYQDSTIKTKCVVDGNKKRLYMGNEFDEYGRGDGVFCADRNKCGPNSIIIIDSDVLIDKMGAKENLALSKKTFADKILNRSDEFKNVDFSGFEGVFRKIKGICAE